MAKRRCKSIPGFEDWQVQFLLTGEIPPDSDPDSNEWETSSWYFHGRSRNDPVKPAWKALRGTLLPAWISRHPGSRPYGWWVFESGLERRLGGLEAGGKVIGKNVLFSLRDSIPADQRGWLQERKLLESGE